MCHGGAKDRISAMQSKFSPPPPQLVDRVPHDPPAWIFWVTKHGVRMTGMPAWDGLLTDDQIWKIVAFIKNSGGVAASVRAAWEKAAGVGPR
jgi:mono/diheme cytochrome c family protein